MRLGAVDYFTKPFSMDELRLKVRQHLEALYRISHMNTGITIFHHRDHWPIEGINFRGWSLQTWNDPAHL